MDRKTSIVCDTDDNANVMAFPSNYDGSKLFLAINDRTDIGEDDDTVVSSIILTRAQVRELISELTDQLVYMEVQHRDRVVEMLGR